MKIRLTINDCRPEVLAFAVLMELKLRHNDHKAHWSTLKHSDALILLDTEVEELNDAVQKYGSTEIAFEAADVANCAMFLADNAGGLK